jgi:hypothetical protein
MAFYKPIIRPAATVVVVKQQIDYKSSHVRSWERFQGMRKGLMVLGFAHAEQPISVLPV